MQNKKHFLVSIVFFFFLYDVQLKGLPSLLSSRKLAVLFLIVMSVIQYRKGKGIVLRIYRLNDGIGAIYKNYLIGICCIWGYSILIAIFNSRLGNNYVDAKNLTFFLLYSVVAPFFFRYLFEDREALFKTLVYVGVIQSIIIYALFVFPGLRILFDKLFETDARFGYTSINVKVLGLGSGGAALSVLLFLSLYSLGYFLFDEKSVIANSLIFVFIFGAALFDGRTGFFAGILLGCVVVWMKLCMRMKKKAIAKLFTAILFVVFFMGVALGFAMKSETLSEKVIQTLSHIKISETVNAHSSSSFLYVILKMNLPELSPELLYGAGYGRGLSLTGVNVQNDIGYVQRIFSLGIFFGIMFYLINFICFWKISSKVKKKEFRFYYRILILVLFVLELKEAFFYYYLVPSMILLIGFVAIREKTIKTNEKFIMN